MSQKIDPREVLAYLNELGYTNITAPQLKEFIIDLKKLLKYDLRYGGFTQTSEKCPTYCPEESEYCGCESNGYESSKEQSINKENYGVKQKSPKHNPSEEKNEFKDKHIEVHIFDSKNRKKLLHDHCIHVEKLNLENNPNIKNQFKSVYVDHSENLKNETSESTVKSIRPCSTRECQSRASSRERKSKVTFIRPVTSRPSVKKSDPVALYHYYQSEWKRTKIPGQDNRDDLRWAIRERMLNGPRVEVKSKCNVQRRGWR